MIFCMKRIGNLFEKIIDRDNLLLAYKKASKGKAQKRAVQEYTSALEENISFLYKGLVNFDFPIGDYHYFKIFDPKERLISAVSFPERVLHHAIMNVCTPYFESFLIYDSYANCIGKGQLAAIKRAQKYAHEYKWFLKCDIKKYFDSIPHDKMYELLESKFKDVKLLFWFKKIIHSYSVKPNTGLPIGNLSSQFFANLYLDKIDRLYSPFVRYMDDFVFWSNDKDQLKELLKNLRCILLNDLSLELKENSYINQTKFGMDFLGMRIFPDVVGLCRRSKLRYRRKLKLYIKNYEEGFVSEDKCHERLKALTAFTENSCCKEWRRNVIESLGLYV